MTDNDTAVQLPGAIATRNLSVDEDDVDLFVSPRRFGGATPSAKAARDRAFQIHLQGSNSQLDPVVPVAENAGVRKDDSSYSIGTNLDDAKSFNISETIEQEISARRRIRWFHFAIICIGTLNICAGIWMATKEQDKKLATYLTFGSFVMGAPRYYAVSMISIGLVLLAVGYIGAFSLTRSMAAGFMQSGDYLKVVTYQILVFLAAPTVILVLTEACHTLGDVNQRPKFDGRGQFQFFLSVAIVSTVLSTISLFAAVFVGASAAWTGVRQRRSSPGLRGDLQDAF